MRTFAIGDIHGGLRALKQLLERINPNDDDTFIFLGDYVDGWSESAQVIDYLMVMNTKYNCVFIKGNHDALCEDWLQDANIDSTWYKHGGKGTISSYLSYDFSQRNSHLAFFKNMKVFYVDSLNRLFIHAGFTSKHGALHEPHKTNFYLDRTLWEMALTMDNRIEKDSLSYPKRLKLYHEIYIGHTPTLNYNVDVPMQGCNVWNIDTGAGFLGKLSAIDIDTKAVFQSDAVYTLYPDEKGRN
jgi:serine/threonine protein phosphatase 1